MKTSIPKSPLRFAFFETKPYLGWAICALSAVTIASTLDGLTNLILQHLIDAMTTMVTSSAKDFGHVWYWAAVYTAIFACSGIIWRCSGFAGMRWMTYARTYGYSTLFAYLTHHSANYFNNRFAGALTNKIANVADGADKIMQNILWEFLPVFITFSVGVYTASTANVTFSVILCLWTMLYIAVSVLLVMRKRKLSIAFAEHASQMRGAMVDSATNIAAVHQAAHQEFEISHFQSYIGRYQTSGLQNWFFSEWILVTGNALQTFFVALMLWVAIGFLQKNLISVGDVVMIIGIMLQLIRQIFAIGNDMNRFMDFYGQAQEGLQELLLPHEITDTKQASHLQMSEGTIKFVNVIFAYGNQTVFKDFNLTIPAGQKIGLVGHSGAGKTSLTSILLRQYDIQYGDILIDGQSIRAVTQKSIRRHIAIVPQDTSLFHRSIRENIRYGRLDATDSEVEQASKLAQAHEFIKQTPKSYDTLVGERGVKLSGGQRQRIAIARAILKNAPILVLDEATSALDSESEIAIQHALQELMKGKTVLAIAHRLSTLRVMDRIIVIEDGAIVEDGTHEDLMKRDGIYASLWATQVSGFIQE